MTSANWQKQNANIQAMVRFGSLVVALLLALLLWWLDILTIDQTSLLFLTLFITAEVAWAFILKNRFANTLVRVLRFDYEESEYDFRMMFKRKHIVFQRTQDDAAYTYEFPGHALIMRVEPHWVQRDPNFNAITKVTLGEVTEQTVAFAETLANAIDEMAERREKSNMMPVS